MAPRTYTSIKKDATVDSVHIASAGGSEAASKKKKASSALTYGEVKTQKAAAFQIPLNIVKSNDKKQIFGWASVVEKGGVPVIDKHNDVIPVHELEKAAYDFVLTSREHDNMHVGAPTGHLIESMVFTKEKQQALGIDLGKVAWWTGWQITDDALWAAHKRGERNELSIAGRAIKETV